MGRRARTATTRPTAGKAGPVAAEVRERWQRGDQEGAAASVTDEMVLAPNLIGTEEMVRARLAVWRGAVVNTVGPYPAGAQLYQAGHPAPRRRVVSTANPCQMNLRSSV